MSDRLTSLSSGHLLFRFIGIGEGLQPARRVTLVICVSLLFLVGCAKTPQSAEPQLIVTDEFGREVKLKGHPKRIVSLAPSITESLFALGLANQIVGVTSYCDYPAEAKVKEKVGDTLRPSLEKIVALKPDLVIISTSSQLEEFVRKLEEVGVAVYISNPKNVDEVIASVEKLGGIVGAEAEAQRLAATMRARLATVRNRIGSRRPPRVLFILGAEPLITVGGHSFINDLIDRAGGISISADERNDYPQYSLETAVARQPEVIFLQAGEAKLPEKLGKTPAAQTGRIYQLDDALMLRPGPRIVEGIEQMAAKIFPDE